MAKRLTAAEMIRRAIEQEGTAYVRGVIDALTGERDEDPDDEQVELPLVPKAKPGDGGES